MPSSSDSSDLRSFVPLGSSVPRSNEEGTYGVCVFPCCLLRHSVWWTHVLLISLLSSR
jgi:hypothetical protein